MADAGAAAAVATGRLVRGLSGSGFEEVGLDGAVAGGEFKPEPTSPPKSHAKPGAQSQPEGQSQPKDLSKPKSQHEPKTKEKKPGEEATSLAERRAAKKKAALEEAQAEFDAAESEAKEADEAATQAWNAVKEIERRRKAVQADIEECKKRLASWRPNSLGSRGTPKRPSPTRSARYGPLPNSDAPRTRPGGASNGWVSSAPCLLFSAGCGWPDLQGRSRPA